jgi:hypothetical protein
MRIAKRQLTNKDSETGAGLSIFSKIERAKLEERSILLDLEAQNKKTITLRNR